MRVAASRWVLVSGCALGAWACTGGDAPDARPNLVLVSIDTLRADHTSVYGYERPTTPRLERLAAEAVVFERFFYSGGGTLPSHMSMMTSLYPATHDVNPHNERTLEEERTTLAEVLSEAGYATAGFADAGWMRGRFGFSQGFDLYDDEGGRFEAILPKALRWLDAHAAREPFFLFVHTYDVHSEWHRLPYSCPGENPMRYAAAIDIDFDGCRDGRCASALLAWVNGEVKAGRSELREHFSRDELAWIEALYDGCIHYADERLGELFSHLESLGVWDETLVVVTSDHGEEFGEKGRLLHDDGGYEFYAHIPLIAKLPRSAYGGTRVDALASMVDVMPTLLDLLGLPVPDDAQGTSLLPAIRDGTSVRRDFHMYDVLRTDRFKLFRSRDELYDLADDPAEISNVYAERPDLARTLGARLRELNAVDRRSREAFAARAAPAGKKALTPEEVRGLEALGYLDVADPAPPAAPAP